MGMHAPSYIKIYRKRGKIVLGRSTWNVNKSLHTHKHTHKKQSNKSLGKKTGHHFTLNCAIPKSTWIFLQLDWNTMLQCGVT